MSTKPSAQETEQVIYAVVDQRGTVGFASNYASVCHEHINDMIADGVIEAGQWVVSAYAASLRSKV